MVESLSEIKEQLQQLWVKMDKKTKIIIGISVLATMIGIIGLVGWAGQPAYKVLFNNLASKDAGAIINKLKEKQVPYKLENQGAAILVPQQRVYQLRLELASNGLPSGGVTGFELFDQTQIGTTDFAQKVNYMRALSGELSRTIRQFNNISYAKVKITPAKNSIYTERVQPAKASVLLKLDGYQQLSTKQVKSIANLVAGSVKGLQPNKVTIVDTAGNLLSAKLESKKGSATTYNQLELQSQFEGEIEKDLNIMLTKVLGMNNFVVRVNANLNFSQRSFKSTKYSPVVDDRGIVRSKQTKEESEKGISSSPEGVPGTTSNLPQYKVTDQEQQSRESSEEIINYEINKKIEKYVQSPGDLERLSVSVIVNQKLNQQRKNMITEAISAAVGYNKQRGDEIKVVGMKFDNSLEQQMNQQINAQNSQRETLLMTLAIIVGALILIVLFLIYRRGQDDEQDITPGQEVDYVAGDEVNETAASEELDPQEQEIRKLQQEIRELAVDQPEEIAELLKGWLEE
ncbi:flagellar basal-body M-ring protein/flagellar hook-basal body protein FliF [Halobacteroides halobius DSM 5150]|uniref:Flagellar M-ring protein n=1 Tax=Halobacteroides halobius (strain ATCC 35273 / DSM 5150 / MD-1) TaxID=748449 RepID=L0K7U8_HALHC|nr:flagellar basal-body MS-ring/collar protein FliF [Halobacteroides halobius]AGB40625.1 flagellar basal-body M-ring protein/flagellar hook-basal body protein FliF [Halobacteroides halobius DSM 5150]